MKSYHLLPKSDEWELNVEGGSSLSIVGTKEEAVEVARKTVRKAAGSLKIHKGDGTFEEERTYPHDEDPVKSPG